MASPAGRLCGNGEEHVRGSRRRWRAHARDCAGCPSSVGGAKMSWVTWTLILTGVGLNAAAQLLLKVATRPLGHFSDFSLETLRYSVLSLGASLPFWAGMLCYGTSVCVWLAALAKAPVKIGR